MILTKLNIILLVSFVFMLKNITCINAGYNNHGPVGTMTSRQVTSSNKQHSAYSEASLYTNSNSVESYANVPVIQPTNPKPVHKHSKAFTAQMNAAIINLENILKSNYNAPVAQVAPVASVAQVAIKASVAPLSIIAPVAINVHAAINAPDNKVNYHSAPVTLYPHLNEMNGAYAPAHVAFTQADSASVMNSLKQHVPQRVVTVTTDGQFQLKGDVINIQVPFYGFPKQEIKPKPTPEVSHAHKVHNHHSHGHNHHSNGHASMSHGNSPMRSSRGSKNGCCYNKTH